MKVKQNLSPNGFQTGIVELIVKDKDGITKQVHKQPMDSFVSNYWKMLYYNFQRTSATLTRFGGTTVSKTDTDYFNSVANAGADYKGIIVGSGSATLSIDDTALDSLIPHGTGTGELEYLAMPPRTYGYDAVDYYIFADYERAFINNSGGSIDVNELGLAGYLNTTSSQTNAVLMVRDVLSSTITLDVGDSLTVRYRLRINDVNRNAMQFINFSNETVPWYSDFTQSSLNDLNSAIIKAEINALNGIRLSTSTSQVSITYTTVDTLTINTPNESSGPLFHGSTFFSPLNIDTNTNSVSFHIRRDFTNQGASPITVNSMVLASDDVEDGTLSTSSLLFIAHIILSTPVILQPGETKTGKWIFEYTI